MLLVFVLYVVRLNVVAPFCSRMTIFSKEKNILKFFKIALFYQNFDLKLISFKLFGQFHLSNEQYHTV